jgi:hypothetical protein
VDDELINKLNQLKEQTACSKKHRCLVGSPEELYFEKYHAEADLMECLDGQSNICKFSIAFSETFICRCPLRKFVAINFDELYKKNKTTNHSFQVTAID